MVWFGGGQGVCGLWDFGFLGFFWSVSWHVGFGVFVEFWVFVCFILLELFFCWCAFRRSILLDLGCKMF